MIRIRIVFMALALAVSVCFSSPAMAAPVRVALVIGNANYASLNVLSNPVLDARNVTRALSAIGYQVTIVTDADRAAMLRALAAFQSRVETLESGSIALIYYAGHGFEVDGSNYLAPTDANISGPRPTDQLLSMDLILQALGTNEEVAGIALFDACRQLPPSLLWRTNGFVRIERHNTFVAFSTAFNATASDGGTGLGSPFANALTQNLGLPGLTPSQLMERVRVSVHFATGGPGGSQTPVDTNNLVSRVILSEAPATHRDRRVNLAYEAFFSDGLGQESLELALPAAREGNVPAMTLMGHIYFQGFEGTPRDELTALRWYRRAMDAGGEPERLLWASTVSGSPVASQRDRDEAIEIVRREAARGDPAALYAFAFANLGHTGIRFTHFSPDLSLAVQAYRQAAGAGHVDAAINFGLMAYEGEGLPRPDPESARTSFFNAAGAGSPRGMVKYANMLSTYREGQRNPTRDGEAIDLYRRAAQWNEPEALLRLAVAYAFGVGVEADRNQALVWLARAERAATPEFRASNEGIPRQIDGFARALRSGTILTEPACLNVRTGCALVVGF